MSYIVFILVPLLVVTPTIIPNNGLINYSGILAEQQGQFKELQYSFVMIWDSQGVEDGQFNQPHSIDVDSLGNVYVADSGNSRVQKFTSDGQFITKWGSEGTKDGQFIGLHDVAVDPSGKFVYTVELGNKHRVQKFTSDGQFITKWSYESTGGIESYVDPHQIAMDSLGNVYIPDKGGAKVLKFDGMGKLITKWGSEGTDKGQFRVPHGVAVDSADNVYITDMNNSRVQKFDSNGKYITMWGGEGKNEGQFSKVTPGIDIDYSDDSVYIIDKEGANVQKFSNNGKFITKWGTEGVGYGEFKKPEDIAINSKTGAIYVTDTGNSRIQVFGYNSQK